MLIMLCPSEHCCNCQGQWDVVGGPFPSPGTCAASPMQLEEQISLIYCSAQESQLPKAQNLSLVPLLRLQKSVICVLLHSDSKSGHKTQDARRGQSVFKRLIPLKGVIICWITCRGSCREIYCLGKRLSAAAAASRFLPFIC